MVADETLCPNTSGLLPQMEACSTARLAGAHHCRGPGCGSARCWRYGCPTLMRCSL